MSPLADSKWIRFIIMKTNKLNQMVHLGSDNYPALSMEQLAIKMSKIKKKVICQINEMMGVFTC